MGATYRYVLLLARRDRLLPALLLAVALAAALGAALGAVAVVEGRALALAFAEVGDFGQAVRVQKAAIEAAEAGSRVGLARHLRGVLLVLESGRPWRPSAPADLLPYQGPP